MQQFSNSRSKQMIHLVDSFERTQIYTFIIYTKKRLHWLGTIDLCKNNIAALTLPQHQTLWCYRWPDDEAVRLVDWIKEPL